MPKKNKRKPTYDELADLVVALTAKVHALEKRVDELEAELAKARKNSSNSHKPPSSDIAKPPKERKRPGERPKGGQPGHSKHEREPFKPEEVDGVREYALDACPDCRGPLEPSDAAPRIVQQVEIVETPVRVDEHRGLAHWCARCRKIHYGPLPPEVEKAGLAGPRLTALAAYMKGGCHASYSTIQAFLRDVAGVAMSRGQLAKLARKAGDALEAPYEELLARLPDEPVLNVDETGHKDNGDKFWTWCFRAELYALFKIDKTRGTDALSDALGKEFGGVLGCDYFSSYRGYMRKFGVPLQFCLAHLVRDLKFLAELPHKATAAYGRRLLEGTRELFRIIHDREKWDAPIFAILLKAQRAHILAIAGARVPKTREAQNMARRLRNHGDAYFQFIATPGVGPTNNLAEQAIRFVVLDRRVTQGTRSPNGRRWCERIWTVMASCALQHRSPFHFLLEAVNAHFADKKPPSLLPASL